jgi:acyl-CoA thioesterase
MDVAISLSDFLSTAGQPDGSLDFSVPESWLQGRTAYGGLLAAAAYRAARAADLDLPPLCSAQIAFVGPVSGRAKSAARVLRRGRSSAFIEVHITEGDATALAAIFLFAAARESALSQAAPPAPPVLSPDQGEPAMQRITSSFAAQMEYRHASPARDRQQPEFLRWVRLRDRAGLDAVTEILAIADALPSAALLLLPKPAPVSSANWTVHLTDPAAQTEDGWWLVQSRADFAATGACHQTMSVWNSRGVPVMLGSQQVLVFG